MPRRARGAYSIKYLSQKLGHLAMEAQSIDNEGNPLTRAELLAQMVWDKALGYTERTIDEDGEEKITKHAPERWAIEMIFNRLDGREAQQQSETILRTKTAEKVTELAAQKLNELAKHAADGRIDA